MLCSGLHCHNELQKSLEHFAIWGPMLSQGKRPNSHQAGMTSSTHQRNMLNVQQIHAPGISIHKSGRVGERGGCRETSAEKATKERKCSNNYENGCLNVHFGIMPSIWKIYHIPKILIYSHWTVNHSHETTSKSRSETIDKCIK